MDEVIKKEIFSEINYAKSISKKGLYGKSITVLNNLQKRIDNENIMFSFWDDLLCWDAAGGCGEVCGDADCVGCCCGVIAVLLLAWGCKCLMPECECSNEFIDSCICGTGKGILEACWDTCCCCC